jgi:ribosomal protein S6-L-glutamate ligase RimK-like protein
MNIAPLEKLPKLAFLYLDQVLHFFEHSNFKGWPDKIETVVYHWGNDKQRFIDEVKQRQIEVLIGNIPATAYESFREIARALPKVQFIPSLDSQFANKSKENVTHLCQKYQLPVPKTQIFYQAQRADEFLLTCQYPKIIKKSYGPSNYGGYYVHKVDDYAQARQLLKEKNYCPVYVQDFIAMAADIRVMLIGHQPVCAFWRRPPQGGWLTNTSQGGTMDYQDVPQAVLDLAVKTSKAANAEYWACDVAVGKDGQYWLLECATAFAAFPYIRDWIGQYLMWKLSAGVFNKPYMPLYHWEELGKIDASLLRTMRNITFSQPSTNQKPINDGAELFNLMSSKHYPILATETRADEEWPSEVWNFQGNYQQREQCINDALAVSDTVISVEEDSAPLLSSAKTSQQSRLSVQPQNTPLQLSEKQLYQFLAGVKGIGKKLTTSIVSQFGAVGLVEVLINHPQTLMTVKNIKDKKLADITAHWNVYRKTIYY